MKLVRRSVPSAARIIVCGLLYFLLRAQPWAAPQAARIDTIQPASGHAGDVINITGIGFGAKNVVIRVGGIPAAVLESTGTRVRFRVPAGLPPGPVTVTATNPGGHTGSIGFVIGGGRAPVANAGPDQTVHVSDVVQLTGAASTDADGDPLTYLWSFTSVPSGSHAGQTLSNPAIVNPTFVVDLPGTYELRLIVSDGTSSSAPDTVRIDTANSPPLANAGLDQTARVGTLVTLDGSLSLDVDGDPIAYSWQFISTPDGGAPPALLSADTVSPSFTIDRPGTFEVQLVVSDGTANSTPDSVLVSTINSAPVANAGADQLVAAGDGVVLDGGDSFDVDHDALTYQWSFVSRPAGSAATFDPANAVAKMPMFMTDLGGIYVAQLVVSDGSLQSEGGESATVTITANTPPVVTASADPASVMLTADHPVPTVQLSGTVADDGLPAPPALTAEWTVAGPPGATISDTASTAPTATFAAPGPYTFTLSASDGHLSGSASVLVSVIEDACAVNNGGCDPLVQCSNTVNGPVCGACPAGYTGDGFQCQDIDECAVNNGGCAVASDGSPLAACTNTDGSRSCGACAPGYSGDGVTCQDIDECAVDNGGCDPLQTCSNTAGSRTCSACPSGYTDEDGQCVDVNECAVNNGGCDPKQTCTNTTGSRECGACPSGYTDQDGHCIDINECQQNNGACDPLTQCVNTDGSRQCGDCPAGYSGNGAEGCVDINECAVNNGGCDPKKTCTNTAGSRTCGDCPSGYADQNGQCIDVNECQINNGGCDLLTQCVNTDGSRTCGACPAGYSGTGVNGCIDVNECNTNNGGCDPLTTCINTAGSRMCSPCPAGYQGSGATGCSDVNECAVNNGGCSGFCVNSVGGFECVPQCPSGYAADANGQCSDINECLSGNGGCDLRTTCTNTAGSRVCGPCPPGFSGTGDTSCVDINECMTNNGGCSSLVTCTNTIGSRICGPCPRGFTGNGTVCTDINECLINNGGCAAQALCINTQGSRICGPCPSGYTGTGTTQCTDINECLTNNGGCDPLTQCTNTPGSRLCGDCPSGYSGTGATGCSDINECQTNNGGCDPLQTCTNTLGSRVCGQCPAGYTEIDMQCVPNEEAATHSGPAPIEPVAEERYVAVLPVPPKLRHSVRRRRNT